MMVASQPFPGAVGFAAASRIGDARSQAPNAPVGRLSATLDVLAAAHGETHAALHTLEEMLDRLEGQVAAIGGGIAATSGLQNTTAGQIGPGPTTLVDRLTDQKDEAQRLRDRVALAASRLHATLDALDAVR